MIPSYQRIGLPSVIILDLDMTLLQMITPNFNAKTKQYLLEKGCREIDCTADIHPYAPKCKLLVFSKMTLDRIFQLSAEKNIPIIILTHNLYKVAVIKKVLNSSDAYKISYSHFTFSSVVNEKEQGNIANRIFFEKDNKKGTIYFFNRDHINSNLFKKTQNKLKKLTLQGINKIMFTPEPYKNYLREARKHITVLSCLYLINKLINKLPIKTHPEIDFLSEEARNRIVIVDDRENFINSAGSLGMTAIHATIYDEEVCKYNDPLVMRSHLKKLSDFLENGIYKEIDNISCAQKSLHMHGVFNVKTSAQSYTPVEEYPSNPPCVIL